MSYQIKLSNGNALTTVADRTIDYSTSLSLVGRGSVVFGEKTAENLVYLLENFANSNPPARPLNGQLWFDSTNVDLKFYSGLQWHSVATEGSFGDTLSLKQGTLLSGAPSGSSRASGVTGVVVSFGATSTTIAVTLAEGTIIAAWSSQAIAANLLPATTTIVGHDYNLATQFPNGLVAGVTLAQSSFKFAGSTELADFISSIPFILSGDDSGVRNAISVRIPLKIASYSKYLKIQVKVAQTNTGPTTINVNGIGICPLVRRDGSSLQLGDLVGGLIYEFRFDGIQFVVSSALATDDTAISIVSNLIIQNAANAVAIGNLVTNGNGMTSAMSALSATSGQNSAAIVQEQTVRANADSALAQQIVTLTASGATTAASLTVEQTTRSDQFTSLSKQITTLTATAYTGPSQAAFQDEITARASADQALSDRLTTYNSQTTANIAKIVNDSSTLTTAVSAVSNQIAQIGATTGNTVAQVNTEVTARTTADTALATRIDSLTTVVGSNNASVLSTQKSQADTVSALSTTVTALQTKVGDNTASIQTVASSVNGQNIGYQVIGTINGVTGGLSLTGVAKPGGATYNLEINSNVTINGNLVVTGVVATGVSKLSDGTIVQRMIYGNNGGYFDRNGHPITGFYITFPTAFPTQCDIVLAMDTSYGGSSACYVYGVDSATATRYGCTLYCNAPTGYSFRANLIIVGK